ncbi:MAG: phosphoribosylanthranilate isomerase [Desulfuromonadaceae bacterium]|nr:phosphoribosylanthranilate isomerase [Geobacteraceae bacterium]
MSVTLAQQRVRTKICGITSAEDARMAVAAGADAIGLVFYRGSKRCVDVEQAHRICAALPPFVTRVGLFVNEDAETIRTTVASCELDIAQLHGDEDAEGCFIPGVRVVKALRLREDTDIHVCEPYCNAGVEAFLLDAWVKDVYGGTGTCAPWDTAARFAREHDIILAGGLNPANVAAAIEHVKPYAVDVSSGVERSAGVKDPQKVRTFIANVLHLAE